MQHILPGANSTDGRPLRYGENPQQRGAFVPVESADPLSLARFEHVSGPDLSYTNWLDADGALYALCQIGEREPAAVVVKHAIACGAAVASDLPSAFLAAWAGDPLAAFGGVVAVNRPVDEYLVDVLLTGDRVLRGLLAPSVTDEAQRRLARRKNLWVLANPALTAPTRPSGWEWRTIRGAVLTQEVYDGALGPDDVDIVSVRQPTSGEWRDLLMAWGLVVATRSNAIVLVRDRQLVGSGAGQQDRLRPCQLAIGKAGERARGAVAASDAFFPFAFGDAPEALLDAGVTAILQPPGSRNDADVRRLCDERGATLVMTRSQRGFRH